jgi:hypothetical protein
LSWGFKGDTECALRRHGTESRDHLFFECEFSSRTWKANLQRCIVLDPPNAWDDLIEEGCSHWKTKSMLGVTCRLVFSVAVYDI